ncbi:guanyl-specific ribonuclease Sa [Leptolyngbyaceae cyanobacterium JSC-12]|nr:guanyl-specific ribonuclease Sa [Leptolyngbyaceae cyanobacterium JSC-12]
MKQLLRQALVLATTNLALLGNIPGLSSAIAQSLPQPTKIEIARQSPIRTVSITQLPPEVLKTVRLIQQGGPFPYRKDGTVFGNRERRLPTAPRGYYREYTVPTPGAFNRGARRLVVGGANEIYYYTSDHYGSFVRVKL